MNAATGIITDEVALHRAHVVHDRPGRRHARHLGGDQRRRQEGLHDGVATSAPASTPRSASRRPSRRPAARSSARCACRSPTRTSRPSCSAPRTSIRNRSSCSCRAARSRRRSARRSPNAAWTRTRSRSCRPAKPVDENAVKALGDLAIGRISGWHYDYNLKGKINEDFVKAFNAEFKRNPDFFAVGGYDGMHLIYEALKKTGGKADGDSLIAAAKGMKWDKPARPGVDRSGHPRHRAERLHPQGREGRRQHRQCRIRQGRRTSRTRQLK